MKELETAQNYTEMLNELRKHESLSTQAYSRISSLITNQTVVGILKALEEMSVSMTSLLRHCSTLLEEEIIEVPAAGETEASSTIAVTTDTTRERDDTFTLGIMESLVSEFPSGEATKEGATLEVKFWYIKGGQNESIELTVSEKKVFGKILLNLLKQIEVSSDEKFSISPLGYEALLRHQFSSSIGHIVKTYGEEFTLIKLYT
ncbi:MAG: hypothetical protein JSV04_06210 [Candidatus Heimdallarchaeota archaeon]|nr:MAG: hypothetical protein JSV04_06210 [Candidatus Heimdallarchaeota archaeon]